MTHAYGEITPEIIRELEAITGHANLLCGEDTAAYAGDEAPHARRLRPAVVVKPECTAMVAAILKLAAAQRLPVVTRGAGTGLSGVRRP